MPVFGESLLFGDLEWGELAARDVVWRRQSRPRLEVDVFLTLAGFGDKLGHGRRKRLRLARDITHDEPLRCFSDGLRGNPLQNRFVGSQRQIRVVVARWKAVQHRGYRQIRLLIH